LAQAIGWRPRPFDQTLRDTIEWMEGDRPEFLVA
jgi:nucleoside-diphosphate-sugar epimerase